MENMCGGRGVNEAWATRGEDLPSPHALTPPSEQKYINPLFIGQVQTEFLIMSSENGPDHDALIAQLISLTSIPPDQVPPHPPELHAPSLTTPRTGS